MFVLPPRMARRAGPYGRRCLANNRGRSGIGLRDPWAPVPAPAETRPDNGLPVDTLCITRPDEKSCSLRKTLGYANAHMDTPELSRLRAAIAREPGNAELHYLLGAELAHCQAYPEAVLQMRAALDIDPKLHFARLQ